MVGRAHDAEVDEFCGDIGVDHTNDESRDDNECKGSFLVGDDAETSEGGGGRVLA